MRDYSKEKEQFERLLHIMDELREQCPWDKKQTIETLRPLTIEETYELADAILDKDYENIKKELQGVAVEQAEVKLENSKINYQGPVLITHWGLSGPAVLKLSAFGAQEFFAREYKTGIVVNWVFPLKLIEVEKLLKAHQKEKHKALPYSHPMFKLPRRLWEFLCEASGIYNEKPWAEINNKTLSKLATNLFAGRFYMHGKTTFKEEFVTCGGVDLKEIDFRTMESKLVPGLFFCGEVINIDGITGGFNFQNAWSTAWICANSV
jgi:predicted Rossmann fold flavoprotein